LTNEEVGTARGAVRAASSGVIRTSGVARSTRCTRAGTPQRGVPTDHGHRKRKSHTTCAAAEVEE